jgi:hypothetical protein
VIEADGESGTSLQVKDEMDYVRSEKEQAQKMRFVRCRDATPLGREKELAFGTWGSTQGPINHVE